MYKSRSGLWRKIDLGDIAHNDHLGIQTETGEKHFNLMSCRILRLIEENDRIIQYTSSHKSQRRYLNDVVIHVLPELRRRDHFLQRVVERLEVRVEFIFHFAGQKT